MKIITGILVVAVITLVVGCAAPSQPKQTKTLSYEVVRTYTVEVIVGTKPAGPPGGAAVDLRNKACVEIKNTGNIAGLFSVYFFFSKEYFGQDLIYLKPGETGVASYIPFHTFEDFRRGLSDKEFNDITAKWRYEITPVALNPSSKK